MHTILHIGIQKTGSKSLQHWMAELASRDHRVAVPRSPDGTAWHKPLHLSLLEGTATHLETLTQTLRGTTSTHAFVSYEGFFELPDPLANQLVGALCPDQTVIFLRDQVGYLNSFANQVIKAHRTSWDDIVRQIASSRTLQPTLDFATLVRRWADRVEPGDVVPLAYSSTADSIERFVGAINPPLPTGYSPTQQPGLNPALDAFGLAVLRESKRRLQAPNALPALVTRAHQMLSEHFVDSRCGDGAPLLLEPRLVDDITTMYAASNRRLHEEFGIELKFATPVATRFVNLDEEAQRPECREMVDELLAAIRN